MNKKTLNVKRTTNSEIAANWELDYSPGMTGELFVRCNAKGEINWEKAPIYRLEELLKRGDVNLLN
jgi:hypothetical protein